MGLGDHSIVLTRKAHMISVLFCLAVAPLPLKILFLGNSHTSFNDVPGMVKRILEADAKGARVAIEVRIGGNLESLAKDQGTSDRIAVGRFTHVVLQGAALSSSHKYRYSQEGAVRLAQRAKQSGSEALLFAEWSRKGWKETGYILGVYKEISKESQTKIVPVCSVFDSLLAKNPKLDLWQADGNHSSKAGSYVASLTIAQAVNPRSLLKWRPADLPESLQLAALEGIKIDGRLISPQKR